MRVLSSLLKKKSTVKTLKENEKIFKEKENTYENEIATLKAQIRSLVEKVGKARSGLEISQSQLDSCEDADSVNLLQGSKDSQNLEHSEDDYHIDNPSSDDNTSIKDGELSDDNASIKDGELSSIEKITEDNASVSGVVQLDSVDVFLPSDDEFHDDIFFVSSTEVKNFKSPQHGNTLSTNVKVPKDLDNKTFKPKPTSLNNKLVFIALGASSTYHRGEKKACGLQPACGIFLKKDSKIAKVRILLGNPTVTGKEVWACEHHSKASAAGFGLQMQTRKESKITTTSKPK